MNEWTDQQLLSDYARRQSDAAFGEIVRRHVDVVYSAALRMVHEVPLAEDVTQSVFVALAQNAARLAGHPVLIGWLHCTTRNLAAKTIRTEVRRRTREQEAAIMNQQSSATNEFAWEHIAPHLDAALSDLTESDRNVILLRFFERKSARAIAGILRISEDAAQKRVSRAVGDLQKIFAKRGIAVGAACIAVVLTTNSAHAAPSGLVAGTCAAVKTSSVAAGMAATIIKGVSMKIAQKVIVTAAITAVAGVAVYEMKQSVEKSRQLEADQVQIASSRANIRQLESVNRRLKARGDRQHEDTAAPVSPKNKVADGAKGDTSRGDTNSVSKAATKLEGLKFMLPLKLRLRLTEAQEQQVLAAKDQRDADEQSGDAAKADNAQANYEATLQNVLSPDQWTEYTKIHEEQMQSDAEVSAVKEASELRGQYQLSWDQQEKLYNLLYSQTLEGARDDENLSLTDEEFDNAGDKRVKAKLDAMRQILSPEQFQAYQQYQEADNELADEEEKSFAGFGWDAWIKRDGKWRKVKPMPNAGQ